MPSAAMLPDSLRVIFYIEAAVKCVKSIGLNTYYRHYKVPFLKERLAKFRVIKQCVNTNGKRTHWNDQYQEIFFSA